MGAKIYFCYAKQRKLEQKAYLTKQIFNFVKSVFQRSFFCLMSIKYHLQQLEKVIVTMVI